MNNLSKTEILEPIFKLIGDKSDDMRKRAQKIYDAQTEMARISHELEIIDEKIDLIRFTLQKEIVEEKHDETGKAKHSNDLARKSELIMREQSHEPLKMLKADRASQNETLSKLQALIEFERKQFTIGEKILLFLANQ